MQKRFLAAILGVYLWFPIARAADEMAVEGGAAESLSPSNLSPNIEARFAELYLPAIRTDAERLQFLMWLHDNIPQFFQQIDQYPVDLFRLLQVQAELQARLMQNPQFREFLAARRPLVELTIAPRDGRPIEVEVVRVSGRAVDAWREGLAEALNEFSSRAPEGEDFSSARIRLYRELSESMREANVARAQGLVGALTQLLPREARDAARAMPRETDADRLRLLNHLLQHLPSTVESPVLSRHYGIPSEGLSREQVLRRVEEMFRHEPNIIAAEQRSLRQALLAAVFLRGNANSLPEAAQLIRNLSDRDLAFFLDRKDALIPLLERLRGEVARAMPETARSAQEWARLENELTRNLNRVAGDTERIVERVSGELILREQPPRSAIPKGCVAGDCSTERSFAYPNDPTERVFYASLRNASGEELVGVVTATHLEYELTPGNFVRAIYLHTMNGGNLSASHATAIMHAFHARVQDLGAELVVLPHGTQLNAFINSPSVRKLNQNYTEGRSPGMIRYPQASLRAVIEAEQEFNFATYDHMALNTSAIPFEPRPEISSRLGVQIEIRPQAALQYNPPPLTTERLFRFALDMHNSPDGRELRTRAIRVANIDTTEFNRFNELLFNFGVDKVATVAAYDRRLAEQLGKVLDASDSGERVLASLYDNRLERRPYIFSARLFLPDAMTPENRARTLTVAYSHWLRILDDPSVSNEFTSFLEQYSNEFAAHPPVVAKLSQMIQLAIEAGKDGIYELEKYGRLIGKSQALRDLITNAMRGANPEIGLALARVVNVFDPQDFRAAYANIVDFRADIRRRVFQPIVGASKEAEAEREVLPRLTRFIESEPELWRQVMQRSRTFDGDGIPATSTLRRFSQEFYELNLIPLLQATAGLDSSSPEALRRSALLHALDIEYVNLGGNRNAFLAAAGIDVPRANAVISALHSGIVGIEVQERKELEAITAFFGSREEANLFLSDLWNHPQRRRPQIFGARLFQEDAMLPEHARRTLDTAFALFQRAVGGGQEHEKLAEFIRKHEAAFMSHPAYSEYLRQVISEAKTSPVGILKLNRWSKLMNTTSFLENDAELRRVVIAASRLTGDDRPLARIAGELLIRSPQDFFDAHVEELAHLTDRSVYADAVETAQEKIRRALRMPAPVPHSEDDYDSYLERPRDVTREGRLRAREAARARTPLAEWPEADRARAIRILRSGDVSAQYFLLWQLNYTTLRFFDLQEAIVDVIANNPDPAVLMAADQRFSEFGNIDPELVSRLRTIALRRPVNQDLLRLVNYQDLLRLLNGVDGRAPATRANACVADYARILPWPH